MHLRNPVNLPSSDGTMPVSGLPSKAIFNKFVRLPSSVGIVPVNPHSPNDRVIKPVNFPREVGIVALKPGERSFKLPALRVAIDVR